MAIIRVQAKGSGRKVSWSELKQGRLVAPTGLARVFGLTTTLTDVIVDLCVAAEGLDSGYRIVTVAPNGPTTATLDLALLGEGFEITCSRRLVRGLFPLNPFAAEFGANYDVVVTISAPAEVESRLVASLRSAYACARIA